MHDLLIALSFVAMVLAPCFVASKSGSSEMEARVDLKSCADGESLARLAKTKADSSATLRNDKQERFRRTPMQDLLIALAFVAMILAPAIVAKRSGSEEMEAESY